MLLPLIAKAQNYDAYIDGIYYNFNKTTKKATKKKKEADDVPTICPVCGKGHVIKGKTAWGCSRWKEGCTYRKPFDE